MGGFQRSSSEHNWKQELEKVRICEMLHRNGNVKKSFEDWFKWLAVFAAILAVMTSLSNLLQYRCS